MKRAFFLFFTFLAVKTLAATYYVDVNNANPAPPYTSWATAATNIQDAVDVSTDGDLVLVNDGVYQSGGEVVYGSLTNRVVISKAITVQSVNGPAVTVIQGYQDTNTINGDDAVRCVFLSDGAVLSGFTLTNGATQIDTDESWDYTLYTGGGVFCDATNVVVTNCVITACSASDSGGGAEGRNTFLEAGGGTFLNCAFTGNQCIANAGADQCILIQCTLTGNTSGYGGGAGASTLINCTVANNSATADGLGAGGGVEFCTLIGCTLETNFSDLGGGAWGNSDNPCTLCNCTLIGNSTSSSGGGSQGCTLINCALSGNSGFQGGGVAGCTLTNCSIMANSAYYSGGADSSTLNNCTLTGNSASYGGGAGWSTVNGGAIVNNSVQINGGGVESCTVSNCRLTGNSAVNGGGADSSTLNNCALAVNSALFNGGGAENCTMNNCTLVFNSATGTGGGADSSTLNNCIVYFNSAPGGANSSGSTLNFCCTTPSPASGTNNITANPELTDITHLSAGSPCIGAGSANYSTGVDLDGQPWLNPPSIGCNEYYAVAASGQLTVAIQADYTNVAPGFAVTLAGLIYGHATGSFWNFGDGTTASNQLSVSHSWAAMGTYPVVLTAYNDSNSGGICATAMVCVTTQQVYYVNASSTNSVAPFSTWSTAATNIQDAVDAAVPGGIVLVTNGLYATGGQVVYGSPTNRIVINKPIMVRSVNGPAVTIVQGCQDTNTANGENAVRCVYLVSSGITFAGFTLTNGGTLIDLYESLDDHLYSGGGIYCESSGIIVSNCIIAGCYASDTGGGAIGGILDDCILTNNSSYLGGGAGNDLINNCVLCNNSAGYGGGAYQSTLNNCMVIGDLADYWGGGAAWSVLNNCTLVGNLDGAYGCTMNDCVSYYNNSDNYSACTLNYCCTTPCPGGIGNITNEPCFANWTNNDFHLQSNSPCINSGNNFYVTTINDLGGNPRIIGGTVDMGAYEYQTPVSVLSYAWAQQYGLPTDGSVDYADLDGTGMNDWQKWIAGLNPTNPASVLVMLPPAVTNNACGITVSWESVCNRAYFLQRSSDFTAQPPFSTIESNIIGQPGTTTYMDTTATNSTPYFYRVGVQ